MLSATRFPLLVALACSLVSLTGTELGHQLLCWKSLQAADGPSFRRQYAPDREVDIVHFKLDVTPDFTQRTVSGRAVITFRPIAHPLETLRLDAVDLRIASVTAGEPIKGFDAGAEQLTITFAKPIPPGKEVEVTIEYSAEPQQGLYFRTPEMGYKPGETHLFTQGEPILARHWYPCYDFPNEKFTSEIICRIPPEMIALSNGRLMSDQTDPESGLRVVRWLQDKPHVNYLISLIAGYLSKIEDRYGDIPLAFYTPPSQIAQAENSLKDTKDMMAYFEKEIGVPYPWSKYYQVCVNDFVAGGMENTSITTLTDQTLFTEETENLRSSQGLVAHELAHQWFGDLVTCKDWGHLWLNEGFATYYAHLYSGHKDGRDTMLYGLYRDAQGIIGRQDDTNSIVRRTYATPNEQFSYLAYPKGSWVLHMLRSQLGESLFRKCIQTYLERHAYGTVVTEDLNSIIEEISGRSFDRFFDQWVYHAHHPELRISYSWDEKANLAKVSIAQNQKLGANVLLFQFPLVIRFRAGETTVDRRIIVEEQSEDFYFPLEFKPEIVRVDPEFTLLAKIDFDLPDPMIEAQLADKSDAIGRVLAVAQLGKKQSRFAVNCLKRALQEDPFHGVRAEAARALRSIHTDEAFEALTESLDQPDARVRREVVEAIAGFYREGSYDLLRRVVEKEKNPDIVTQALQGLAAYSKPETKELLLQLLSSQSYRQRLFQAAVVTMRAQGDPDYLEPLRKALEERAAELPSQCLAQGLTTLARLARDEENKEEVREFIVKFTSDKRVRIVQTALTALGELGDTQAIPVLETFARAGEHSPGKEAAERALTRLRDSRRPAEEVRALRSEVLELQKQNRKLQEEMEELRKQWEASRSEVARQD